MKDIESMSPREQLEWLTDFNQWADSKLPFLCSLGESWESNSIKSMEEGLKLIDAFSFCRDFVEKTLLFRDFSRRIARMKYYVAKIRQEIDSGRYIKGTNGETLAFVPQEKRKRGRPTLAESNRRKREREKQEDLFGGSGDTSEVNAETDARESDNESGGLAAAIDLALGSGTRLHFDQLEWLMSDPLRQRIKGVSSMRATAAKESNQAKELALQGASSELIAPHASEAVVQTNAYKQIYKEVDQEFGKLYAALFGNNPSSSAIYEYGRLCERHGIQFSVLRKILKPYWEKIGSPASVENEPEVSVEEDAEKKAERQARLHRIRTYFMRKDVNVTQNRVDNMRNLIEEVRSYGLPTEEYEVILQKTMEELRVSGKEE